MTTESHNTGRSHYFLIASGVLFCFFLMFAGLLASYIYQFDQQLSNDKQIQLSEISNYVVNHMTTVVSDTQKALQSVSKAVAMIPEKERLTYLREIGAQYDFAYIGYAKQDGMLHATVPSECVNISKESYFIKTVNGSPSVSNYMRKIFTSKAVSGILLTVPYQQGEQRGVLVAMLENRNLRDALNQESFGGQGYSYIIDTQGTIIMRTKSLDVANLFMAWKHLAFQNGYSLQKFREDVANNRKGFLCFQNLIGSRQYAYYNKLPFNNWTVVSVVPEQAVSAETVMLTRELAFIGGGMLLLFLILMFWGMHSKKISQESKLAADAKSAFLANMSHEIRTPMNAIVGLSEIMLRDDILPRHREQLVSIFNSAKGLLTIINDILDISKIESGQFTIIGESYELESLFYDLTIIAAIRIGEKPLQFMVELDPELPRTMIGDMGRVKQILLNIIGNAIKFTNQGSVCLRVKAEREEQHWQLHVEIRDTGIGIKPEDLDKMFVRFSQVDTKRNRNVEGTGLGLTISQKLCEMMGGQVTVSSEYGQGSSFLVRIQQGIDTEDKLIQRLKGDVSLLLFEESKTLHAFEAECLDAQGIPYTFSSTQDEFKTWLRTGKYTHALAARSIMREADIPAGTRVIGMLGLKDHSLVDAGGSNIYLPLFAAQLPYALNGTLADYRAARHASMKTSDMTPMPHVSVLIVDDNELNILVAEGLMAPYAMQIDHVYSGRDAIAAVQKNNYDMVLMDHMMPEMDGVEATRIIRALPDAKYAALPIIALTANTTTEARQMFLSQGFNDFLSKPIETSMLNKVLTDWLEALNTQRATRNSTANSQNTQQQKTVSSDNAKTVDEPVCKPMQPAPAPHSDRMRAENMEIDFAATQPMAFSQEFYIKLLETFCRATGETLAALPLWMTMDPDRVVVEVHGIKSASASIGARDFSEAAQKMESYGLQKKWDVLQAELPAFLEHGQRVLEEINVYLEGQKRTIV